MAALNPYVVPPLTRAEVETSHDREPRPANCPTCTAGTPVEHWPSSLCKSVYRRDVTGTERLSGVHCTCYRCF